MRADVRANDFPETTSRWHSLGREAGFGGVRELFVAPTDHFRMYCFSAVIDVRLRHHRHFVRDYLSNRRPIILKTRMEGPKIASFCSRVSICGSMGSHPEGPSRSDGISLMLSRLRRFDSRHSRF